MDYLVFKELYHSGIKGMKWGVRRYQDENGNLTAEGKKRYLNDLKESKQKYKNGIKDYDNKTVEEFNKMGSKDKLENSNWEKRIYGRKQFVKNSREQYKDERSKIKEGYKEAKEIEKSNRKAALKDAIQIQKDIEKEYGGIFGTSARDRRNIKRDTNRIVGEKYGNKTVKDLSAHNTKVGLAIASGLLAANLAVTLSWIMDKSYE